jgi:hypothetical protein
VTSAKAWSAASSRHKTGADRKRADSERTIRSPSRGGAVRPALVLSPNAAGRLLELQRAAGNRAVGELVASEALALQRHPDAGVAPAAAPTAGALDEKAKAIVDAAQADTPSKGERAKNVVWSILKTYYADRQDLIKDVTYPLNEDGLMTTTPAARAPKGSEQGSIAVGDDFLEHTTKEGFARRVLQVGHELMHVEQHRKGLGGHGKSAEREFLAFAWEGTAAEVAGTGHMNRGTRLSLINAAIKNYQALSEDDQKRYKDQYDEVVKKKEALEAKKKRATAAP